MILSRKILLLIFISLGIQFSLQAGGLDSLEQVLEPKILDSDIQTQIEGNFELGKAYLHKKDLDKALEYLLAARDLSSKINNSKLKSEIQFELGVCYSNRHNYGEAIGVLTEVVKYRSAIGGSSLADASFRLARAYQSKGNNELAFEYHFKALQIREELKDQEGIAASLYQIGGIHFYQSNYHKAIEYYEQCLTICEEIKYQGLQISTFVAIGAVHSRLNEVEESLKFNTRAYELAIETNKKNVMSYITYNLGDNYKILGDNDKALKYFQQAHDINIQASDRWGQISTSKSIGEIYIGIGNEKEGLRYLRESLKLAKNLDAKPIMVDVYKSLARNLEHLGDYKEANQFYRDFIALKDSLRSEATLDKMADTKMQYEISQKEKDILRRDNQLQNMYRNFLIVGLLGLMVILWQLHVKYKSQTEHNRIEREKNQKIQQQNEELEKVHLQQMETNELLKSQNEQMVKQNQKLEHKNEELQRFAYIASHDLKEPLRNIGSFATLLKRRFKGQLGEDADEYINFITTNVSRMYDLLHEVLMYSKLENEEIVHEWVSLDHIVATVKETMRGKIMEQNVKFDITPLPEVRGHKSHLQQLFQNLISNSIKYNNNENPLVEVGVKKNFGGHDMVYYVKDNGIGIDMEFKERVFEIFKRLHGKDEYEGTGVGLAICKKIVNSNHGDIWLDSEIGKGATFYFTLNIETQMPAAEATIEAQGMSMN